MMGKTHAAIGITAAAVMYSNKMIENPKMILPILTIASISSYVPDIDKKGSTISNKVQNIFVKILMYGAGLIYIGKKTGYFNSYNIITVINNLKLSPQFTAGLLLLVALIVVSKFTEHRSFTHSFIGLALYSSSIYIIDKSLVQYFIVGYGLHLVADSFTDKGIEILFPFRKKIGFGLISTGKLYEIIIRYACYGLLAVRLMQPLRITM